MVLRSSEKLHGSQQQIHQLEAAGADRSVLSKLNQTIEKLGEELVDLGLSDASDDELYWQQVDLEEIIRHHVANCQHIASKRGIELHVDQPQNTLPFTANGSISANWFATCWRMPSSSASMVASNSAIASVACAKTADYR